VKWLVEEADASASQRSQGTFYINGEKERKKGKKK